MSKYSDKLRRRAEEAARREHPETAAQQSARVSQAELDERKRIAKYNRRRELARFEREHSRVASLTNEELVTVARSIARQMHTSGICHAAEVVDALCTRLVVHLALDAKVTKALLSGVAAN